MIVLKCFQKDSVLLWRYKYLFTVIMFKKLFQSEIVLLIFILMFQKTETSILQEKIKLLKLAISDKNKILTDSKKYD